MTEPLSAEREAEIREELEAEPRYAIGADYRDAALELLDELDRIRAAAVVEHGIQFGSGDWKIRSDGPAIERIYPLTEWIDHANAHGNYVGKRKIIVLEDWKRVPEPGPKQASP